MIAQSFQLINAAGYALVEATQGHRTPIIKAHYAFLMATTILFFLVPLALFLLTDKRWTNIFLWSGTICYLIQMSCQSSFANQTNVQIRFGWAGFSSAIVASTYLFFRREKFKNDTPIYGHYESGTSWSNFFNASVLVFLSISYAGFYQFSAVFNQFANGYEKAIMILACIAFILAGIASLFSFYETKFGKPWFMFVSFVVHLVVVAMSSHRHNGQTNTHEVRLAFGWIATIVMFMSNVCHQIERKMF